MRQLATFLLLAILVASSIYAGKESPARTSLEEKDYNQVVQLLGGQELSSAEDYYLLGKAHKELGQNQEALDAWKECLLINKNLSKRSKWSFLFSPNKKLKGTQKKRLKDDFEDEFKDLSAIALRQGKKGARNARNAATRKDIEANRLNKKADAKSEAIRDKQHVADRRAMSGQGTRHTRGVATTSTRSVESGGSSSGSGVCGVMGFLFLVIFIGVIVMIVVFSRRSRGHGHMHGANTNALDREIMNNIDEREAMRNEAADLEAESDHLEQDAVEIEQDMDDIIKAADSFDDDELRDDEGAEDEEEFADDEGAEEEEE